MFSELEIELSEIHSFRKPLFTHTRANSRIHPIICYFRLRFQITPLSELTAGSAERVSLG